MSTTRERVHESKRAANAALDNSQASFACSFGSASVALVAVLAAAENVAELADECERCEYQG
ncbi:MAG: hypothetical protein ACT6RP_05615, partial [Roseateles sp.]|uniref:hypothetical protein n=1 Tax=Roseateles sp. TaxID=1971397 RepID=UPI00403752F6